MSSEDEIVRLHITPFTESLYPTIIAPSVRPHVSNASYHTIQTDPSSAYGYVSLPRAEADKLRKKYNGMVLRGSKMKIEMAKPEKRKRVLAEIEEAATAAADPTQEEPKSKKKKIKAKKSKGEISGFELPEGRSVKRGWTEESSSAKPKYDKSAADKKDKKRKQEKSKFTSGKEVLFKTHLPEKSAGIAVEDAKKEKKDKKEKKLRDKLKRGVVIHEFEKNTQYPSFLRQDGGNKTGKGVAAEFVEGKGWVDENGEIVEAITVKGKREDRLAAMPQNELVVKGSDDEDDDQLRTRERRKKIKTPTPEPVVKVLDELLEETVVDDKTKAQLAKFDKMLEDDSDSEENFKDAGDDSGKEEKSEDEQSDNEDSEDQKSASEASEADDSDSEQDDEPKASTLEGGKEETMTFQEEEVEDEDMAESGSSDDDQNAANDMDKQPVDRKAAKLGKTTEVDGKPADESDTSEEEDVKDDESSDSSDNDSDSDSDSESDSESDSDSSSDSTASASDKQVVPAEPNTLTTAMDIDDKPSASKPEERPATPPQEPKEVHPLEALYKRPKVDGTPKPAPIQTSFSFGFGNDNASDTASVVGEQDPNEDYEHENPHTPYSSQEQRYGRGVRSAAPTPDTAAIGKRFSFAFGNNSNNNNYEDIEEEGNDYYGGEGEDDEMAAVNYMPVASRKTFDNDEEGADGKEGETGFAKWFWENRGDSNRAWKKRRREVMKVQRQRENRRVGRKIV